MVFVFVSFLQQSSNPATEPDPPFENEASTSLPRRVDATAKPELHTASNSSESEDVQNYESMVSEVSSTMSRVKRRKRSSSSLTVQAYTISGPPSSQHEIHNQLQC